MTEISFNSDIKQHATNFNYQVKIQDTVLNLNLDGYNNINTYETLKKWQTCFSLLGKGNLYPSKDVSIILYCLLTDASLIKTINNNKVNIDLYNPVIDRFYGLETITKLNRNIKLKIFPICKTLVIVDWKGFPTYKVYELYNLDQVKEYYENKKANFDTIIKDINLKPKYIGQVNKSDFKALSINNFVIDKQKIIKMLEDFMIKYKKLERQIQKEYKRAFKKPYTRVYLQ